MLLDTWTKLRWKDHRVFFGCRYNIRMIPLEPLLYYQAIAFNIPFMRHSLEMNEQEMLIYSSLLTCAWSTNANMATMNTQSAFIIPIKQVSSLYGMSEIAFCKVIRSLIKKGIVNLLPCEHLLEYDQGMSYFLIRFKIVKSWGEKNLQWTAWIDKYGEPWFMYKDVDLMSYLT